MDGRVANGVETEDRGGTRQTTSGHASSAILRLGGRDRFAGAQTEDSSSYVKVECTQTIANLKGGATRPGKTVDGNGARTANEVAERPRRSR